jgi:hypothetical protein
VTIEALAESSTRLRRGSQFRHHCLWRRVASDIASFLASITCRRGFMQIPTTVLAQVDASVGKNWCQPEGRKNLIGAFHQPRGVD